MRVAALRCSPLREHDHDAILSEHRRLDNFSLVLCQGGSDFDEA